MGNLEFQFKLTYMFLDCGRNHRTHRVVNLKLLGKYPMLLFQRLVGSYGHDWLV